MTPTALCFDATGTLIETTENVGEVYHRVALEHGVDLPAWRLDDAFRRILRRAPPRGTDGDCFETRCRRELEWWFERIRETFQATDSTARFEDFPAFASALFERYRAPGAWQLRPGSIEMLTRFRAHGYPLCIVSNFDHRLPEILGILDLSSFFELVVIPVDSGRAKPDRAVFEIVSQHLSMPLDSLGYIGDDSKKTLRAIEDLGLQVVDLREIDHLESLPDRFETRATLRPRRDRG